MKIAIDIRALMEGKTTGVEVYQINLLHALFQVDSQSQYILWANSWKDISLPEFAYPNVVTLITRYPNKLFNLSQKFLDYPKIDKLLGGLDLFFSPHWRVTALSSDVPLVVTFHDLFFEVFPKFFTWRRRLWHWFMNYKQAAVRADRIIAVSESTKKDLLNLYEISESKIKVIYSAVQHSQPDLQARGIANHFLFFGTFEPRKNINAIIQAYEIYFQSSSIKRPLYLAGSSGWKIKMKIPENLQSHVKIERDLSEDRKTYLFKHAFTFLFPSLYEGFGFPILEAAAVGLPVIASYNTSLSEIGEDFVLFVNPVRPSQIALAMLDLENDKVLYENLRLRGLEAVKKFFWANTARETLKILQSV